MNLLLWRHADAEFGPPDLKRQLTPHGHRQAALVADWLRPRLDPNARILVSPAMRAQQTAAALTAHYLTADAVGPDRSASDILHAAHWPDAPGTTLIVSHQPILGQVASLLMGGVAGWEIDKAALWWFSGDGHHPGHAVLRAVISPELLI